MIPFTHNPRLTTIATTLLRVVVGATFIAHGSQKLADFGAWQGAVEQMGIPFPAVSAYLALGAELIGGALLLLGALTPLASAAIAFTMLVAIVTVHLDHGFFAKDGGFEYPFILGACAIFFLLAGPGPVSVDHWLRNKREERTKNRRWRAQDSAPAADAVTEASEESFPASDAPGYNPGRA